MENVHRGRIAEKSGRFVNYRAGIVITQRCRPSKTSLNNLQPQISLILTEKQKEESVSIREIRGKEVLQDQILQTYPEIKYGMSLPICNQTAFVVKF